MKDVTTIKIFEEHHTPEGEVTNVKLVAEVDVKTSIFKIMKKRIYYFNDFSEINQLLEDKRLKYFGYDEIELKDGFYVDCVDSEFRFKRPHIIFTLDDISK